MNMHTWNVRFASWVRQRMRGAVRHTVNSSRAQPASYGHSRRWAAGHACACKVMFATWHVTLVPVLCVSTTGSTWARLRMRSATRLVPRRRRVTCVALQAQWALLRRGGRHGRRGAGARVGLRSLRALARRHRRRARRRAGHARWNPLRMCRQLKRRRALPRLLQRCAARLELQLLRLRQRLRLRLRLRLGRGRRCRSPACAASARVRAVCKPDPKKRL